ncbi:YsnF/AvaK domain-containing protein [Dyadobacter alkalitolerans]|uniref:YsnF/AvaK domain-containing protein n=1 Tax=Dyadobacter alkalitolerans TaxID=492736 RepID=UPI00041F2C74|nr:YsnF/AvaK domain-containing protein [Dyadobacter alkalitolerans]
MANTVVGIFEYESDAQEAQNYLLANGFAGGDVDIKTASYKSDQETSTVNNDDDDVMDRIGNFFRDLFDGDEEETRRYSEAGRRGTIVTVHAANAMEAENAAAILDQFGAVDVNDRAAQYTADQGYAGTATEVPVNPYPDNTVDPYANRSLNVVSDADDLTTRNDSSLIGDEYSTNRDRSLIEDDYSTIRNDSSIVSDDISTNRESSLIGDDYSTNRDERSILADEQSGSLPVIKEELQVGKREIETGGVRLRSRIIERPVQESVRLRQEQVNVNRTPVDRIASESDFDTFTEGTIEMKEYAEIPVVNKEARVVEEVSLNKTVDERDEVINEMLRHTEVEAEDLTDEERLRRRGLDL